MQTPSLPVSSLHQGRDSRLVDFRDLPAPSCWAGVEEAAYRLGRLTVRLAKALARRQGWSDPAADQRKIIVAAFRRGVRDEWEEE